VQVSGPNVADYEIPAPPRGQRSPFDYGLPAGRGREARWLSLAQEGSTVSDPNPVLNALIAYEESDGSVPFEEFHYYHAVDWDRFATCAAAFLERERKRGAWNRKHRFCHPTPGRQRHPDVACESCGRMFHPSTMTPNGKGPTRFCSRACKGRKQAATLTYQGETRTYKEWAAVTGLDVKRIQKRAWLGWSPERILEYPVLKSRARYVAENTA
jgi:hypothetical protein